MNSADTEALKKTES